VSVDRDRGVAVNARRDEQGRFGRDLEQAMTANPETERRAAQGDRIRQRRAGDVFEDVRRADGVEELADLVDEVGVSVDDPPPVNLRPPAVSLTGRRRVDRERSPVVLPQAGKDRQRVGPVGEQELEREPRLRDDVDADDLEPGARVARSCATRAAEQVEQDRTLGHRRAHR